MQIIGGMGFRIGTIFYGIKLIDKLLNCQVIILRQNRNYNIRQMLRKVQTRSANRQHFYHETQSNSQILANDIIRPPTSHPYSGYKSKKSQSQMRSRYCPNFFIQSRLETNLKQIKQNFISCKEIDKLPQNFKLVLNQLRVLIKNGLGEKNAKGEHSKWFEGSEELVQNLAKIIGDVLLEKDQLIKIKLEYQKNIQQLNLCVGQLEKKLSRCEFSNQYKKSSKKYENTVKLQQQILVQNCRLGQLNARYLARISQLENRKIQKCIATPQNKQNQTKMDTELLRCHNRINYLQMKLNTAQKLQHQLTFKNQQLEEQLQKCRQKISRLETAFNDNSQKMTQWRERAMMQKEDGEIHIARQQFLLYSLKKLRENNKNLLNKFLTVYKSDEKIQKKDLIQNPNFQYEFDFFKSIRSIYDKGKGQKLFTHNQVKKNQLGIDIQQVSLETDYQNYKKSDSFDVSLLRYYRPNFFSFLQQSASPDIVQSRNKSNNSVSRVFIQLLRAIMLSKLNEFMFSECPQKYTRFPEFVYSWFQKFYFNTQKNTVCSLQPFMQKPISQQLFYKDLMNVKLDQSWQIITFREFLLEQLSLQQLYFYLHSQMLLFSKSGITKQIQFYGDFTILVEYGAAKCVLDVTLSDFQSWNINFLGAKLREKVIIRGGKEMVEAGFVLRCLVEYYRIQRSNRLRYIGKLCGEFKDGKDGKGGKGLRFMTFMSVINKFTEVSMQSKLKLYRDCYCLTRGVITPESIFIVCSEQLVFLKHLKMKSFYRLPKIISKPSSKIHSNAHNQTQNLSNIQTQNSQNQAKQSRTLLCIQPPDPYLYDIILSFTKILYGDSCLSKSLSSPSPSSPSSVPTLLSRLQSFGVNEFNHQLSSLIRSLDDRNSQLGSNVLKCRHFLHYFSTCLETVRKVSYFNLYELLEEENKKKTASFCIPFPDQELGAIFVQQMMGTFESYRKIGQLVKWKQRVYQFRVNSAAKKIQRQVKKKFIEPYLQIYNYFRKEVKDVNDQKDDYSRDTKK